jgi:hypothetical protein
MTVWREWSASPSKNPDGLAFDIGPKQRMQALRVP